MSKEYRIIKDDRGLYDAVVEEQSRRRAVGTLRPDDMHLSDVATLKARREGMQPAPGWYHVVIAPDNGHYRAYAPAVPEVTALGETPERAQAQLVTALAAHLKTLRDHGEPLPPDRTRVTRVGLPLELQNNTSAVGRQSITRGRGTSSTACCCRARR